jgi:hypothetical protein
MSHTFLFEPGVWMVTGMYWSADAQGIALEGRTEISHGRECWMLAGRMRVLASPPAEFASKWTSENSTLGRLHGVFTIVGKAILSLYRSEQGGYQGCEHLLQITADQYEGYGMLLMDDRRLSSWQVKLTR